MMNSQNIINEIQQPAKPDETFWEKYISVRKKENRLCTDEEVLKLPEINIDHPHYNEWMIRKNSAKKLVHYLQKKLTPLSILEIGCGNGWLSYQLSQIAGSEVLGIDINPVELKQAQRVFSRQQNLKFMLGDIRSGMLLSCRFDIIIFAASIQYFNSLKGIIALAQCYLSKDGEVHILDSPLYAEKETAAAKTRTAGYYGSIGFPEMAGYYFHHALNDLSLFHYKLMYNPFALSQKLLKNKNPFYWICLALTPTHLPAREREGEEK